MALQLANMGHRHSAPSFLAHYCFNWALSRPSGATSSLTFAHASFMEGLNYESSCRKRSSIEGRNPQWPQISWHLQDPAVQGHFGFRGLILQHVLRIRSVMHVWSSIETWNPKWPRTLGFSCRFWGPGWPGLDFH